MILCTEIEESKDNWSKERKKKKKKERRNCGSDFFFQGTTGEHLYYFSLCQLTSIDPQF